jgi:alpha-glucosidase (family GH31 glycosyl hydrolase)
VATKTNVLAVDLSQGSSNWTLSNADSSQVVLLSDILADITPDGSLRLLLGRAGNVYGSSIPSGTDVKAPTPLTSSSGSTTASSHSTQTPTFWDDRGFRVFSVPVDLVAASQVDTQPVSWSVDGTTLAITTVASRLDVYFTVASNVQNGVASLWELTSPPSLLPSWAFGLQVSSETWASADALDEVITQARSGYSGLDTVIMDYHWFASTDDSEVGINGSSDRQDFDFDKVYFRTPAADRLADWHGKNVRVGGMRWPRLTNNASLDTARVQGCVVADSRTWNLTKNSCQQLLSTDLNAVVTKGLDLFWNDQLDVNASNYLETNQWASAQGTTLGSKVRVYGWTRSYVPGLQSLGYATIGDEVDSTWTGLQQAVSMMLHAQLVGQSFAAPMMGGSSAIQDPALLVRSYQSAALMPIMRMHLPASDPNRLPFAIADSSVRAAVDRAVQLRYWLLPFIYSHHRRFINDPNNVRPLITPMASVCLPEDGKACMQCLNQWLVADSLLAAPVLESGSTIEVMFPSFQPLWYYFNTTNSFNNTRTQSLDIDLDQVPMFAAVGAIIPVGCSVATHANEPSLDPLLVHVYTGVDGALMFELDDGLSVGGAVLRTNFTWDDDRQGLSWDVVGTLETPLYALIQAVAFFPDLAEPLYSNVRTFTGSGFFSFQQLYKQARFGSD